MGSFLVAFFESDTIMHVLDNIPLFLTGVNCTKIFVSLSICSFVLYIVRRVFWG